MSGRLRSLLVATLTTLAFAGLPAGTATAAEPATQSARARAARVYDAGVHAFEQSDYAVAARRFLDADAIAPNDDALRNALVSAQRSADAALVRETAQRVLARPHADAELVSVAQAALVVPQERSADVVSSAAPLSAPTPAAPLPTPTSGVTPPAPTPKAHTERDAPTRAWARPAFYSGVVLTAVLTGLTIWSGVDALAARDRLPGTQADNDAVEARAHRTDALLAGTLVAATGTLYVGVRWVDWGARASPVQVAAEVSPTRAFVAFRRTF